MSRCRAFWTTWGIYLGLENEAACYVGAAQHARTFFDKLQCPRVRLIWDPANHYQDPQGDGIPAFPEGYELVKADLVHVHAKDAAETHGGKRPNVFLGAGACSWPAQLQALKDDGYDGYVSLETHVKPEQFPEAYRERYGQHLEGSEREAASKVCLAWLRDTIGALR